MSSFAVFSGTFWFVRCWIYDLKNVNEETRVRLVRVARTRTGLLEARVCTRGEDMNFAVREISLDLQNKFRNDKMELEQINLHNTRGRDECHRFINEMRELVSKSRSDAATHR